MKNPASRPPIVIPFDGRPKKGKVEPLKGGEALFKIGLPSLDEAISIMYALSFGPLSRADLVRALKRAGVTMPNGGAVTSPKVAPSVQRLKRKEVLTSPSSSPPVLVTQARRGIFETARKNGWLLRLGAALRQAVPAELVLDSWERKWTRRQFVSFAHACRDVFLALEGEDADELDRLGALCGKDQQTGSLVNVLVVVCAEPFEPELIERVPTRYRDELQYHILHLATCELALQHPVFAHMRAQVLADGGSLPPAVLDRYVNHLAERDVLAGDFAGARALLDAFADQDAHIVRGMLELLSGNLPAARQAYDQAVRNVGKAKKDQVQYLQSFPALLHMLLLVQSEQPGDRQQARKWLNWMRKDRLHGLYGAAYDWLGALLSFHEGCSREEMPGRFQYHAEVPLAYFANCLMELICCLYIGQVKSVHKHGREMAAEMEGLVGQFDKVGIGWPAMQIARLLQRLGVELPVYGARAASFFEQGSAQDLSELWTVKEVWESQVGALASLIQTAEPAGVDPEKQSRRLGWKLDEKWEEDIQVIPVEQKRSKTGRWTKGRDLALRRLVDPEAAGLDYLTDQDKRAMQALGPAGRGYYHDYELDTARTLEKLAGHPNVFWEGRHGMPVEIVAAKPEVQIMPRGGKLWIAMNPYPRIDEYSDDSRVVLKESPTRLRVVAFEPLQLKMAEILGPGGLMIPKERAEQTLEQLQGLSKHIAIQSDVAMTGADAQSVEPDCRPHLLLQRFGEGLQAEMVVLPLGQESQRAFTPGTGNAHLIASVAGRTLQTQRDLKQEAVCAGEVVQAVPILETFADRDYAWILDDPCDALELLDQLQAVPPEGLTVEWPKGDPIAVHSISARQLQFSVRSVESWFEVDGTVRVDEDLVLKMQMLLDQIDSSDSRFIPIGKGQYVALTREFRKRLEGLSAGSQPIRKGKALRVHPLAAIGLEQWRDEVGRFKADAVFDACIERFRAVESYQAPMPSTFRATLRPYQEDGFQWLSRLAEWGAGACLADDMGLGKTLQALALILHRAAQGPTLVVAPTSVCANWVSEARRFAPTLNPIRFGVGDHGQRDGILSDLKPFDLVICSYTILQQEAETLKDVRFATLVLDEAQAIKNAATKRSSAAMTLAGDFRLICTGTPIENRLAELWNLFRFINPGLLGSEKRFQERFIRPIEMRQDSRARGALKALVQPFLLRRTKSQVLDDLPPLTEMLRLVELSQEERALHESLRQRALERLEGVREMAKGRAHIQVLAELMKLRRCCCHPCLVVPDCGLTGSKLAAFAELVDELRENRHKALVFSQFVDHLTLLRAHLDKRGISYQYLDGQTPARVRQTRIDAFQEGAGDLFLISLKAGGLGLNLTAADYVIHMDPWWNPAVEDQASGRAHRIGQTRPVTVYRLVAADTIEEKIIQLHHAKRDLADSLLEGTDAAHALTADELIDLLRNQ